jgi:hypothetical protein
MIIWKSSSRMKVALLGGYDNKSELIHIFSP